MAMAMAGRESHRRENFATAGMMNAGKNSQISQSGSTHGRTRGVRRTGLKRGFLVYVTYGCGGCAKGVSVILKGFFLLQVHMRLAMHCVRGATIAGPCAFICPSLASLLRSISFSFFHSSLQLPRAPSERRRSADRGRGRARSAGSPPASVRPGSTRAV